MERQFANQFEKLTYIDLTTIHNELKHIKDEGDNFLMNLDTGAIDTF